MDDQQLLDPSVTAFVQGLTPSILQAPPIPDTSAPPDAGPLPSPVQDAIQRGFQAPLDQSAPPPIAPAPPQPDATPQVLDVPSTPQEIAKSNANVAQQQAFAASPQGQQQQAAQGEMRAVNDQAQATNASGDVAQKQSADEETAIVERNRKEAELIAADQKAKADEMQKRQQLFQQSETATDEAAKKTVDPGRMWNNMSTGQHVLAGIGILLAGLGQGLSGDKGPNPAMKLITDAIDRDVDAQKADMGQANKTAEQRRQLSEDYGHITDVADQQRELQKAALYKQTANQLEAVGAHYKGQQQQQATAIAAAQLRGKASEIQMGVADKGIAQQHAAAELANQKRQTEIAGGHLALAQRQETRAEADDQRNFDEKKREFDLGLTEKILTAKSAGKAAEVKQLENIRQYGLSDPSTGELILDKQGEALKARADAMEAQARQMPTAQADAVRAQASALRDQAERDHHIEHQEAPKAQAELNSAQNVLDATEAIKEQLAKDPGMTDRAAWAGLKTRYENAKISAIKFFDGKPSSREMTAFEDLIGPNGSSMFDRAFSKDKMLAQLNGIQEAITSDADTTLRGGARYRGGFRLKAKEGDLASKIGDKTALESADDATPGIAAGLNPVGSQGPIQRGVRGLAHLTMGGEEPDPTQVAENKFDGGPTGLSKRDTAAVASMIGRYNTANDSEQAKILTELTAAATSTRSSVANGVLGLLRENPEIYARVVSTLPADQQKALSTINSVTPLKIKGVP